MRRISNWRTAIVVCVALVFGAVAVAGYFQGTRLWGDVRAIELTTPLDQQPGLPQAPVDDEPIRRVDEDADDGSDSIVPDDGPDEDTGDGDATAGDDGTSGGNNTGDGDATAGDDGTSGGNNTGDGSRDRSADGSSKSRGSVD